MSDREPASVNSAATASSRAYVTPPFLVAAVGASAGGLDAFTELVHDIPPEAPLAIVLAQHLKRDRPSVLPEILEQRTALQVKQASDGLRIEPGHVYVIPPGKHMTVIDGHLRVRPRPESRLPRQVDALFQSIAEYYREKAVGIILSGALSDGATGFGWINRVGGVTIAQAPEEAEFESMPRAAIATGDTDLILPARQIARELLRLAEWPRYQRTRPLQAGEKPSDLRR